VCVNHGRKSLWCPDLKMLHYNSQSVLLLYRATITNQTLVDRERSSYYYLPLIPRVSLYPHHLNQRSWSPYRCSVYSLPVLEIYSIRYVHYRFSVLAMNIGTSAAFFPSTYTQRRSGCRVTAPNGARIVKTLKP